MAVTNNLVPQVDLPVWEWLRFAPVATQALSTLCVSEESENSRYMYYLSTTFWRYDTKMDSWQQLQTPNVTPSVTSSMRFANFNGYSGNILGGTNTTLEIPSLQGNIFNGYKIRITSGLGAGQEAYITGSTANSIGDNGVATTATVNLITDSLKKWEINQWIGYSVRLVYNTGQSQIRKVLYNDANTLYFYDINYNQLEVWNNTPFSIVAPYAAPSVVAGSQTTYYIESTIVSLDRTLAIIPNDSSSFTIESGGIFLFSSLATAPWSSMQFYDILSDTWNTKTALGGLVPSAFGTDFTIERTGQHGGIYYSAQTVTSASTRTIYFSGATYPVGDLENEMVRITSGPGAGGRYRIVGNTTNTLEIARNFDIQPDSTSRFEIWPNTAEIYLVGNASAAMYRYSVPYDYWYQGPNVDFGQTINVSVSYFGQDAYALVTGVRNTGGITSLAATPTAGGTGYAVGDLFNITTGGSIGKGRVTAVSGSGVVTSVSLYAAGLTYTTGAGKATTIISGGGNNGLTVNILSVGTVGRITTVQNTNLVVGDVITISGCTEAAWNTSYPILAIDSLTTFDVVLTATASAVGAFAQSTTLIVDTTQAWNVNEHVGKIVVLNTAGTAPTTQSRRIISNTLNTLTVATLGTAAVNGTSRYSITQPEAFGSAQLNLINNQKTNGYATSGSLTTLVDTTKNWRNNQFAGGRFRINSGTGVGQEVAIVSNTNNTLTYLTQTFTPDTSTNYKIMGTYGLLTTVTNTTNAVLTDSTKTWDINKFAGKRVRITSGAGVGQELSVLSNTVNALTMVGVFTVAPDTTSTYVIYEIPPRGLGTSLLWVYDGTDIVNKGRYMFSPRGGGSNLFDRYNITTNIWDLAINTQPHTEIFTTGSMYVYDGGDNIIIHRGDAVATMRTLALNINSFQVDVVGMPPYAHGTPLIGNRMEIVTTADGLDYLYIMRHSGQEMWRTLLF